MSTQKSSQHFTPFPNLKKIKLNRTTKNNSSSALPTTSGAGWSFLVVVFARQTEGTKENSSVFHEEEVMWQKLLCVMKDTAPLAQHSLASLDLFKAKRKERLINNYRPIQLSAHLQACDLFLYSRLHI